MRVTRSLDPVVVLHPAARHGGRRAGRVPARRAGHALARGLTPRGAWFERYQESRSGPESSDRWSRTFKVGPSGSLDLSNISGDIVITGGAGDEIRVEAVKQRARARGQPRRSGSWRPSPSRPASAPAASRFPRPIRASRTPSVDVDYTVQVPASAAVSVRSVSGDLELTGVKGEARLETVSGSVTTANSGQLARVKSVSGDVSVTEGGSGDVLSLGTVSGNLAVSA